MKRTTTTTLGHGAVSLPTSMQNSIAQLIQITRQNAPLPLYFEGRDGSVLWAFLYIDIQDEEMCASVAPTAEMCTHVSTGRVLGSFCRR
jgi:hypothetical protein